MTNYTTQTGSSYQLNGKELTRIRPGMQPETLEILACGVTGLTEEQIVARTGNYKRRLNKFFEGIAAPEGDETEVGQRIVALIKKGKKRGIMYTSPITSASPPQLIELEPVK